MMASKSKAVSSRVVSICSSAIGTEPANIVQLVGHTCQGERDRCMNFRNRARLKAPAPEAADRCVIENSATRTARDAHVGHRARSGVDQKERHARAGQALTAASYGYSGRRAESASTLALLKLAEPMAPTADGLGSGEGFLT